MRSVNVRFRFSCEVRDLDDVWDRWGRLFFRTLVIVFLFFTLARMGFMGERFYVVYLFIYSMEFVLVGLVFYGGFSLSFCS